MYAISNNTNRFLRNSLLLAACFAMFYSASSATFFSGGGRKDDAKKTNSSSLNLRTKNSLTLTNGYRYRASLNFIHSNNNRSIVFNNCYIRYQRGTNIYVLPVKQKAVMKFKIPQKEIK